jgi:hypothetical protein
MKTVYYIVEYLDYEGYGDVLGVYETKDLAEKAFKDQNLSSWNFNIKECKYYGISG